MGEKLFDVILCRVVVHRKLVFHVIRAWRGRRVSTSDTFILLRKYKYINYRRTTGSALAVHRVADDLVRVVLGFFPGEQGTCAGVGGGRQVVGRAGQALPHNHRQFGSGAGCAQPVVRDALVVARVLQCQLVDEQDSAVLVLDPSGRFDGLAVL